MSEFRSSLKKLENLSLQLGSSISSSGSVNMMASGATFDNFYSLLIKKLTEIDEKMMYVKSIHTDSSMEQYSVQTNRVASSIQCKKLMREIEEIFKKLSQIGVETVENEKKIQNIAIKINEVEKEFNVLFRKIGPHVKQSSNLEAPLLVDFVSDHVVSNCDDPQNASSEFKLYYEQVKKNNSIMDDSLDKIMLGCSRLKESALNIHDELSLQHSILDEINKKEDNIHGQMGFLNRRLQKILFDFNSEKVFLYLIMFIVLIAVVGYIVYETGSVRQ